MRRGWWTIIWAVMVMGTAPWAWAQQDWQREWEQTLAAAKKEGTVAVLGPLQIQARDALREPFEKEYGIKVEYLGGSGRTISPRVLNERRADRYLWDVYVGGTTTAVTSLAPAGALDPLAPALILPEVKDPKQWREGAQEFADRAGIRDLVFSPFQRGTIFINPKVTDPAEIKSYKDLLDPKWKGKILIDDPRKPGPGNATFFFFLLHPDLGADYIRALAKQDLIILTDYNQQLDAIAHGRYPILIGGSDATSEYKMAQGLPIAIVDPRQLKEGSDRNPGNGSLAIINRAAHPNAAKVYINWLLSKKGQTAFVTPMKYVSARLDVPTDHVEVWRIPRKDAIKTYTETAFSRQRDLNPLLRQVLNR